MYLEGFVHPAGTRRKCISVQYTVLYCVVHCIMFQIVIGVEKYKLQYNVMAALHSSVFQIIIGVAKYKLQYNVMSALHRCILQCFRSSLGWRNTNSSTM